jgi:hypothetical protein
MNRRESFGRYIQQGIVRVILPMLVWACAASVGGLFVYGCKGSYPQSYSVGGSIFGLTAGGLVLENDAGTGASTTVSPAAGDTNFKFTSELLSKAPYQVTVKTQPAGLTCTVTGGDDGKGGGKVPSANVTSVVVTCEYTIGGSISGLTAGSLVLHESGGADDFTASANGTFTFANALATGAKYQVSVATQPTGLTCTVTGGDNGTGGGAVATANITSIAVVCAPSTVPTYTIGGSISGLTSGGLVLLDDGGDNFTAAASANSFIFATALASGAKYQVSVATQPTGLTCTVTGGDNGTGGGAVATANITNIKVACAPTVVPTYSIGGSIAGLTAGGLVLQDNGGDNFTAAASANSFIFATALASGAKYQVSVATQPTGLICTVTGGDNGTGGGTVASANITNVAVSCSSTVGASSPVLGIVTNVKPSAAAFYNSTISLYNMSAPLSPTLIGSPVTTSNVLSIAIDASSNVYYLATSNSVTQANFFACPAPAAGSSYTCTQQGTSIAGGQWLAVDGHGNAYATTTFLMPPFGVVRFPVSGPTSSNQTPVYTSVYDQNYHGLAVSRDGSTLYVSETNSGGGTTMTLHTCAIATPCTGGGTDITQAVVNASSAFTAVSGALAAGPNASLYVGATNSFGSTTAPPSMPVVLVCTPGTTITCKTGLQMFTFVLGNASPFQVAAGVAADASGNAYLGAVLQTFGDTTSPTPAPTFMAFQPPTSATTLNPFACTTLTASGEPACSVNLLPAPPVITSGQSTMPYAMAVTLP